jgi:hypothetical protein
MARYLHTLDLSKLLQRYAESEWGRPVLFASSLLIAADATLTRDTQVLTGKNPGCPCPPIGARIRAMLDLAVLVAAFGTAIASVIAAVAALVAARGTRQIKHEVRTMNEMTMGQYAEASETRRIEDIAPENRTAKEGRHMVTDAAQRDVTE